MQFKYPHLEAELKSAHPTLRVVVDWADGYVKAAKKPELTITHVRRSRAESIKLYGEDVFSAHRLQISRAADCRTNQWPTAFTEELVKMLNRQFKRPDNLPTALFHPGASGSPHLHLQVQSTGREVIAE